MSEAVRLFIEFHVLASHVPSNLNRDELGTPKTAVFGGERRLRISSQCLKRAWRTSSYFTEQFTKSELGIRTQLWPKMVLDRLGPSYDDQARQGLLALCTSIGKRDGKGAHDDEADPVGSTSSTPLDSSAHLLFLSRQEVDAIVSFAHARAETLAQIMKASKAKNDIDSRALARGRKQLQVHMSDSCERNAVDIALFGRFLTSNEFGQCDAALQVAHALGTQKADLECDYFTAVDDLSNRAGAGHVGEAELAASVFYKYAVCVFADLVSNLVGDTQLAARAMSAIALAMARVVPSGKKNSTAPHNPADYLEVVVRRDAPVNLANAFLNPVHATDDGDVMDVSIAELRRQADRYDRAYGASDVVARYRMSLRDVAGAESTHSSLAEITAALEAHLGGATS